MTENTPSGLCIQISQVCMILPLILNAHLIDFDHVEVVGIRIEAVRERLGGRLAVLGLPS